MTPLTHELARAQIDEARRQADLVRAGRRINADRRRGRRSRKVADWR